MQRKIAQETQQEVLELFNIWDVSGEGIMESNELRCLLNRIPEKLTRKEIDFLVNEADTTKNGRIYFEGVPIFVFWYFYMFYVYVKRKYQNRNFHNARWCPSFLDVVYLTMTKSRHSLLFSFFFQHSWKCCREQRKHEHQFDWSPNMNWKKTPIPGS